METKYPMVLALLKRLALSVIPFYLGIAYANVGEAGQSYISLGYGLFVFVELLLTYMEKKS